jgi:D-alanine-D-alanine ligase
MPPGKGCGGDNMRVAVVHNHVGQGDGPDAADVLLQARSVSKALETLGHSGKLFECGLDLWNMLDRLRQFRPDLVFNLVESLDGLGRLIHFFPLLMDVCGLVYTGCPGRSIMMTSNKLTAKGVLSANGISTPDWLEAGDQGSFDSSMPGNPAPGDPWIVKSVWEHASIGLGQDSLVEFRDPAALRAQIQARRNRLGGSGFAERYVAGREFNLSVLEGSEGPDVLPAAEIVFEGYPPGIHKIVDYQAKWVQESYAFHHTRRRFEFDAEDASLIARIQDVTRRCWKIFDLSGYARVDFRVDESGTPWVLEVNTNPCLSPDAGFAAALDRAGIAFPEAVRRILSAAQIRHACQPKETHHAANTPRS